MPDPADRDGHDAYLDRLEGLVGLYESALKAIRGPFDDPDGYDWRMTAYREAGGGYEGLQAIAEAALATGQTGTGVG